MRKILNLSITLFLICAIATAALAVTNELTYKQIEKINAETEMKARAEVMPAMKEEEKMADDEFAALLTSAGTLESSVQEIYTSKADGEIVGYVAKVIDGGSFGGNITVLVGIDPTGTVTGLKVTACADTPGLGAKSTDPAWSAQYAGLNGEIEVIKNATPSGNQIEAITGATITSKAVTRAANSAMKVIAAIAPAAEQ